MTKAIRRTADRFKLLNAFVDFAMRDLKGPLTAVWLVLYRDTRNGVARVAQSDIASRTGVSERTVRRAITQLRSRGLLVVVRRGGLRQGPSSYRVLPMSKERFDAL